MKLTALRAEPRPAAMRSPAMASSGPAVPVDADPSRWARARTAATPCWCIPTDAIPEPFVDLLDRSELGRAGRLYCASYTVLLDPPVVHAGRGPRAAQLPVAAPTVFVRFPNAPGPRPARGTAGSQIGRPRPPRPPPRQSRAAPLAGNTYRVGKGGYADQDCAELARQCAGEAGGHRSKP